MELEKEKGQQVKFDPNTPETEDDGLIAGQLCIQKILFRRKEIKERSQNLLQLQNDGPFHEKNVKIEVTELDTKPTPDK